MPSKVPTDPDYNMFDLRAGFGGILSWMGMNKQGSAISPSTMQARHLVNARPFQLGYRERGGMEKQNPTDTFTGNVDGIFDAGDTGAP